MIPTEAKLLETEAILNIVLLSIASFASFFYPRFRLKAIFLSADTCTCIPLSFL